MAYMAIYWLSPCIQPLGAYPAFGGAIDLNWSWIAPIVLRNLLATWLICGCWDWFLYFSPLQARLSPYKMNPAYPPAAQWRHDVLWTSGASLVAALLEVAYCYCACNDLLPSPPPDNLEFSLENILWILLITHWRVPHFYLVHRAMHPWRIAGGSSWIPDGGKFLFKHVHSLHHKSHNPTAFSGTSMHPIEAMLYYSAAGIAVVGGRHCTIVLACVVDCAVGAWLGHDGFHFPGSGDDFHQLHHSLVECNYGTSIDAIDFWMGTAVCKKSELKRHRRRKDSKED
jgi:Delta7-sterol 5-desaturase